MAWPTAAILSSVAAAAMLGSCSVLESEATKGHSIAEEWCAECHRVAPDQPSGSRAGHILPPPVEAPSFMSIAERPDVDRNWLRHFMAELHLPMPGYRLSADERDEVITYILSLKPRAS
ncbi:MAG TPA: c-type cytochrome [Aliidongia sp.]|nr:c-type cytochrome [Aliidongia sp.]